MFELFGFEYVELEFEIDVSYSEHTTGDREENYLWWTIREDNAPEEHFLVIV